MAIKPSPRFAVLLLLSHLMAACAVYVSAGPPWVSLLLFLLILLSLSWHLARDALLLLPVSWRSLSIESGEAVVVVRDASVLSGRVARSSVVSPYFIVLRISLPEKRMPVARVIFPDALEDEAYRELCVRLKLG